MPTKSARKSRPTTRKTRERVWSRERGAIDVLVDNATYQHNVESIHALSDEQWDRTFRMNIQTHFYMASAAIPRTRRGSNDHQYGSITGLRVARTWREAWVQVLTAESVERGKFPPRNIVAAHDLRRTGVLVETTEGGKLLADGRRWGICEA